MPQPTVHTGGATCFDRVQAGFVLGGVVGCTVGALFGSSAAIRQGLKGKEFFNYLAKTVIQVGGSFGTFMAIGVGLRC